MSTITSFTSAGWPVVLAPPFAKGGEGSIHAVNGQPDLAAKRYHSPLSPRQITKLKAMVGLRTNELLGLGAWPIDTLHEKPGGVVTGFLMPRINAHKEIHLLYGPKTRLVEFPNATWLYLVHTAANLARVFDVVHKAGMVVGDVNHGNLGVSAQATVKFFDCDSFQLTAGGQQFLCEVGLSTHTPPELQGKSFRGVVRTPEHDRFGMAVLIFQLLFMGRHPFAGINLASGDSTVERAIGEFRFAYGPGAAARKMRQPPATLPLEAVSQPVAMMFERAFSADWARRGRPPAHEWVTALEHLRKQLRQCPKGHHHLNSLTACPWCTIESQIGIALFGVANAHGVQPRAAFDLAALWAQVAAVPAPGPAPALPHTSAYRVSPEPSLALRAGELKRNQYYKAAGITAIGVILAIGLLDGFVAFLAVAGALAWGWTYKDQATESLRREVDQMAAQARSVMSGLEQRWRTEAGEDAFLARRRDLEATRNQLQGLAAERQRKLQKLQADLRDRQMYRYLDRFRLETASINGIGPGRKVTLQSWGIETAADVDESNIRQVPGFGPSLTGRLIDWRRDLERRFVFNPNQGIDPADLNKLDREIDQKRLQLEQQLNQGLQALRIARQQIIDKRATIYPQIERAAREIAQVEANRRAL